MNMTPGDEGDRRAAESNRIAAEGNRMSAEDTRAVNDAGRTEAAAARVHRRKQINAAQAGAYILIVLMSGFGFWQIERTQVELCTNAAMNREAIKDVVKAVDRLGSDLINTNADDSDLASLEIVHEFKEKQLARLDQEVCDEP